MRGMHSKTTFSDIMGHNGWIVFILCLSLFLSPFSPSTSLRSQLCRATYHPELRGFRKSRRYHSKEHEIWRKRAVTMPFLLLKFLKQSSGLVIKDRNMNRNWVQFYQFLTSFDHQKVFQKVLNLCQSKSLIGVFLIFFNLMVALLNVGIAYF